MKSLRSEPFLGFDVETTELEPYRGELRLVQLSNGKNTKVVDLRAFGERRGRPCARTSGSWRRCGTCLASKKQVKIAHNAKFDTKWVRHHSGSRSAGFTTHIWRAFLIAAGEGERRHGLADVVQFFLAADAG